MKEFLAWFWPWLIGVSDLIIAGIASSHAALRKRDSRALAGWVGLIWLAPFAGSLLYAWLGINRIQRKAHRLRPGGESRNDVTGSWTECILPASVTGEAEVEARYAHLRPLAGLVGRITGQSLCDGNSVRCLADGETAYTEMLSAIRSATRSISMCAYIFDYDRAGRVFAEALGEAAERGVAVRVLVDDVGLRYSWTPGIRLFAGSKVRVARFLPTMTPWHFRYANLRNHRKIMVVDGSIGFTGGMNIREGNYQDAPERTRIRDVHFRFDGPVVHQLQDCFAVDWSFTTGESIRGGRWYSPVASAGNVLSRVISDGPDEDLDRLQSAIQGAITCAKSRILIVTPYFIPDYALISSLNTAALKGADVDIVLPSRCNLRLVQWASTGTLPQLLGSGCRIWLSEPPFDHSKLMIVDNRWSLIGSANWDQRSLRLNFELNVECCDVKLAAELTALAEERRATARQLTTESLSRRPLPVRLRDGLARIASPYL